MFYTDRNFATKKALKAALAAGDQLTIFSPGLESPPLNGETAIGGPHYPKPHSWYATVTMKDGKIVKVK